MITEVATLAELVAEVLPIVEREDPEKGRRLEAALLAIRLRLRPDTISMRNGSVIHFVRSVDDGGPLRSAFDPIVMD